MIDSTDSSWRSERHISCYNEADMILLITLGVNSVGAIKSARPVSACPKLRDKQNLRTQSMFFMTDSVI